MKGFLLQTKLHRRRQVEWMIFEYFKVSDTDTSVAEFHEILKVELKNDNLQPCNTRCDKTIIAMKKQPDDEDGGPVLQTDSS